MKFSNEFASCGLNPVPHCIDCQHQNGACFVAFGSSHSVVVTCNAAAARLFAN